MNDTPTINTDDRPPKPEAPPGGSVAWVPPHRKPPSKNHPEGVLLKGHWRVRKGPPDRSHLRGKPRDKTKREGPKKPGPKPGQPRMTSPAHADYVSQRLLIPAAFLHGLRHQLPIEDPYTRLMLDDCIGAIDQARMFIQRFVTPPEEPEEG